MFPTLITTMIINGRQRKDILLHSLWLLPFCASPSYMLAGHWLSNNSVGISEKIDANAAISYVWGGIGDNNLLCLQKQRWWHHSLCLRRHWRWQRRGQRGRLIVLVLHQIFIVIPKVLNVIQSFNENIVTSYHLETLTHFEPAVLICLW